MSASCTTLGQGESTRNLAFVYFRTSAVFTSYALLSVCAIQAMMQ